MVLFFSLFLYKQGLLVDTYIQDKVHEFHLSYQ